MAARPSLLDRRDPSEITLTVYHQCQRAACGSLQGPGTTFGYWWLDDHGLRIVSDDPRPTAYAEQRAAILRQLEPADSARRAQDARAEAPDL